MFDEQRTHARDLYQPASSAVPSHDFNCATRLTLHATLIYAVLQHHL
jgi:hypothetical protein